MVLNNLTNSHYSRLIVLILFFSVALIILYFKSAKSLFDLWVVSGNPAYSHGLILFFIAIYAFSKRIELASSEIVIKNSIPALIALAITSFLWGGVMLAGIKVGHQLLVLMMIPIGLWFLFGFKISRHISLPFFLVLFAIPVWEVINQGDLQYMAAYLVTKLLELTGFLVYREGFDITVTAGSFRVSESCSGMRLLLVAMPLAIIFSSMNQLKLSYSVIFFVVSILVAILTNLIRIYIVVVAGQLTKMQHYFVTEDHVTLGWVLFAVIFFIYFMGAKKIFDRTVVLRKVSNNNNVTSKPRSIATTELVRAGVLLLVGILPGPVYMLYAQNTAYIPSKRVSIDINPEWGLYVAKTNFAPHLLPADWEYRQSFMKDNNKVTMYINYYAMQVQGKEAVSSFNQLYDRSKWHLKSKQIARFKPNNDGRITVNVFLIENNVGQQKYIWQWYYLGGRHTNEYTHAKVLSILGAFVNDTGASMILLVTDVDADSQKASKILKNFASGSIAPITDALKKK